MVNSSISLIWIKAIKGDGSLSNYITMIPRARSQWGRDWIHPLTWLPSAVVPHGAALEWIGAVGLWVKMTPGDIKKDDHQIIRQMIINILHMKILM